MNKNYFNERPTVLVVDDSPDNLTLMGDLLMSEYQIKVANNGEKALKIVRSDNPPTLILLDIMMPDMDGWETIREIESRDLYHKIIICMLTAKDNPDEGMIAIRTGNTRCRSYGQWRTRRWIYLLFLCRSGF